jgi:hypothetical protein
LLAEDIPLDVLFEDEHLIVLNKPAGLTVHPAPGNKDGTLVNALLHHCPDLPGIGGEMRPGIVHRLDKDTSGLMIVARTRRAMDALVVMIAEREVHRRLADQSEECRRQLLQDLANGQVQLLVGTHALLEDPVQFERLGLVVVDEQHRFGVRQRNRLLAKGWVPPLPAQRLAAPLAAWPEPVAQLMLPAPEVLARCNSLAPFSEAERIQWQALWDQAAAKGPTQAGA